MRAASAVDGADAALNALKTALMCVGINEPKFSQLVALHPSLTAAMVNAPPTSTTTTASGGIRPADPQETSLARSQGLSDRMGTKDPRVDAYIEKSQRNWKYQKK